MKEPAGKPPGVGSGPSGANDATGLPQLGWGLAGAGVAGASVGFVGSGVAA
jgi:hypothetical protein